jgi:hypothetical protein
MDNAMFAKVKESLIPEDFYLDSHKNIVMCFGLLYKKQQAIDLITVCSELTRRSWLESVGGAAYISSLTEGLPRRPAIDDYLRIVKEKSRARTVIAICQGAMAQAEDGTISAADLVQGMNERLSRLGDGLQVTRPHREVFVTASEFADDSQESIDWLITGVLQRGANGFFCAPPKGAKSWTSLDMLISLALGSPWLGFSVPNPVKCGLVTREDTPGLTAWRIKKLFPGKKCTNPNLLDENLYINSRRQTPSFFLDNAADVAEMIQAIKERNLELVLLDVFNVIHGADENDNSEMVKIMAQVRKIQDESGAAIGIIHHFSKSEHGSLTQRLRGASAIAGFAEWLIGLSVVDEDQKIRKMEFEMKADQPPDPVYYRIESDQMAGLSRLVRVAYDPPAATSKRLMFGS